MIKLKTPISEDDVRALTVGDEVLLSGVIVTARDQAHKLMVEEKPDFIRESLNESVIYHCGPVSNREMTIAGVLFQLGQQHLPEKNPIKQM